MVKSKILVTAVKIKTFIFRYETSNGIHQEQTGEFLNPGSDQEMLVVRGYYSYLRDDGKIEEVHYVADQHGFQPFISTSGAVPTLPPNITNIAAAPAALASLAGGGIG